MTVWMKSLACPEQHIGIILENLTSSNDEFVSWHNCRTATLSVQSPQCKIHRSMTNTVAISRAHRTELMLPRCGYDLKGGCKLRWREKGNALCTHSRIHLICRHHNRESQTVFKTTTGFDRNEFPDTYFIAGNSFAPTASVTLTAKRNDAGNSDFAKP